MPKAIIKSSRAPGPPKPRRSTPMCLSRRAHAPNRGPPKTPSKATQRPTSSEKSHRGSPKANFSSKIKCATYARTGGLINQALFKIRGLRTGPPNSRPAQGQHERFFDGNVSKRCKTNHGLPRIHSLSFRASIPLRPPSHWER